MPTRRNPAISREASRDRRVQEARHDDPYQLLRKLPEPTVCPQCGAVFHKGHWTWQERPTDAHEEVCPACRRIHDHYPAGELSLRGLFFEEHKNEILGLIHNEEAREKAEHPLSRLMKIEEKEGATVISTTDPHLARSIGEALHHAYHGEFAVHYSDDQQFVRVTWAR